MLGTCWNIFRSGLITFRSVRARYNVCFHCNIYFMIFYFWLLGWMILSSWNGGLPNKFNNKCQEKPKQSNPTFLVCVCVCMWSASACVWMTFHILLMNSLINIALLWPKGFGWTLHHMNPVFMLESDTVEQSCRRQKQASPLSQALALSWQVVS